MRRRFFVVIALLLCISAKGWVSNFNQDISSSIYKNGDGTVNNPYQIWSREDLENLSLFLGAEHADKYFILGANINLEGEEWVPIGSGSAEGFRGKLYGNNKQIHNLRVEGKHQFAGLFALIGSGASIDNLHIESGWIKGNEINYSEGSNAVGSIAAKAVSEGDDPIVITDCSNRAEIIGTQGNYAHCNAGGLIGECQNVVFLRCVNYGDMIMREVGGANIGGMAGSCYDVSIINCINYGTIDQLGRLNTGFQMGGFVGQGWQVAISNSYSHAWIERGSGTVGGLMGYMKDGCMLQQSYVYGRIHSIEEYTLGGLVAYVPEAYNSKYVPDTIRNSFAILTSLTGNKTNTHRILGDMGRKEQIQNNYAYGSMLVNGGHISDTDANSVDGKSVFMSEFYKRSTYAGGLVNWFSGTENWIIRDGKSRPYMAYQSAPVYVESLSMGSARLDLETLSDSIAVYRYTTAKGKERITRFIPNKLVDNYSLTGIGSQDTLLFINYEAGKPDSYPVDCIVGSLGVNIDNAVAEHNTVSVYPNPVVRNNTICIDVDADNELLKDLTLNIYNSLGQLVRHVGISANSTKIDTSDMTPSTYIFVLQGKKGFNKEFKVVVL